MKMLKDIEKNLRRIIIGEKNPNSRLFNLLYLKFK